MRGLALHNHTTIEVTKVIISVFQPVTMYRTRTAALSVIALVAYSFAAPVLQRGARQVMPSQTELMGTMRSGLRVLQEFSVSHTKLKYASSNLAKICRLRLLAMCI